MIKLIYRASFLFAFFICLSLQWAVNFESSTLHPSLQVMNAQEIPKNLKISPDYGRIPLYFIPNEGQVDEKALFYAKASKYTLWLTKRGLIFESSRRVRKDDDRSHITQPIKRKNPKEYTYERDVSRLMFLNSYKEPEVVPIDQTEHKVNYFIGKDKSKWQTDIQTSSAVLYKELYPYIDLKVYGIERQIEYDFVVKPGGEVSDISFEYKDTEKTRIDKDGNLVVKTKFGELEHAKPLCYQVIGGERVGVKAEFKKIENNTYGFEVEDYNKNYELIIDPLVLVYSTYLGGSKADWGVGIAVDSEGAAYVTGRTMSTDFPTKNPIQGSLAGSWDVFITKINSSGTALVYSTYLGGLRSEQGDAIAVDSEGAAYVTGWTWSTDFPTWNHIQGSLAGSWDVFITKINSSGTALVYSTYLGGSNWEEGNAIAVDSGGAAYITGETESTDFPTQDPIQGSFGGSLDVFITKISSSGTALVYSTYLGGSSYDRGRGIAIDAEGAAYVTGYTSSNDFPVMNPIQGSNAGISDVFITKISSSGIALIYSTYLGGSRNDWSESIAIDSDGAVYVTGTTWSINFPVMNPIQGSNAGISDVFITKISSSGIALIYSTYLGGSGNDWSESIAIDSDGAACVTGSTWSTDFPTWNPIQDSYAGNDDVLIVKLSSTGNSLILSTYLGGSSYEYAKGIKVDSENAVYVAGRTGSTNFPTQSPLQENNAGSTDAFITKLCFSTHSLTLAAGTNGTTDPPPGTYDYCAGSEVVIEAIPDEGFGFSHWSGGATGKDNPIIVIMNADKTIKANFVRQYTLTITSGTGGTTDPTPGTYTFDAGAEVTISAIPENGYRFGGWSGDVSSTDNPITIAMNSDISIKANFIRQYTLTLTSGPGGTTQPSPGTYVYDEGIEVTLSCIPDTHCRFSHWSGDASGTSDPLTITIDSDKSITANFIRIIYAPLNFAGQKVLNRSLSQAEYINFLTWQANSNNVSILKYRIYQVEGDTQSLLVELNANTFDYWHRGVARDKQYTYALVAVNNEGREGDRAFITLQ